MINLSLRALRVLLCAGIMMIVSSCFGDSYMVKLSDSLTIGDQWVALSPVEPLKAEKTFQWVLLELEPPLKEDGDGEGKGPNRGKGVLMPSGEVINPEIEVVDQYGNKFNFVYRGAREGSPIYGYSDPSELPRDREYKIIRMRSSQPIKCKAIYWFDESSKDWK